MTGVLWGKPKRKQYLTGEEKRKNMWFSLPSSGVQVIIQILLVKVKRLIGQS